MAKKTLSERFIQDTVAEKINKEYYRRRSAYVATEAYTKLKRADVFIAFMRARKRPYVVVVEAKSRSTIHQLKLKETPQRVRWAGRVFTLVLIVGLSAALGYQWYFNALNTLLLIGLFLSGSALISRLISHLAFGALGAIPAIEQLERYPANEKWIAVGEDTFARPREYDVLYDQCRKLGIGLIVVTARGKMRRRLTPSPRHAFNDYLSSYGKREQVLEEITRRPEYGPSPPERSKQRRQILNGAVLLVIFGFLVLLGYEENYRPVLPDPFTDEYMLAEEEPYPADSTLVITNAPNFDEGYSRRADAGAKKVDRQKQPVGNCAGFEVEARSFIVVDAILNDRNTGRRLAELTAAGIDSLFTTPTDCLNSWPAPGRQTLYTGTVYADRPAASRAAKTYRATLQARGLEIKYGRVVKVRPE